MASTLPPLASPPVKTAEKPIGKIQLNITLQTDKVGVKQLEAEICPKAQAGEGSPLPAFAPHRAVIRFFGHEKYNVKAFTNSGSNPVQQPRRWHGNNLPIPLALERPPERLKLAKRTQTNLEVKSQNLNAIR